MAATAHSLGKWYISIVCPHCDNRILLYPDLSEGKSDLKQSRINLLCPVCKKEGGYRPELYQGPAPI